MKFKKWIVIGLILLSSVLCFAASTDYRVTNNGTVYSYDLITKSPWVDVRAYATVQLAFDAVPDDGGTVYFPKGIYENTSPAWIPKSNTRIMGDGIGSILKKAALQTTPILNLSGLSNIIIENLKLDGNKTNQAVGDQNRMGIYAPDVTNLIVENCYITATSHAGIYTRNASKNVKIVNNTFVNCGQETGSPFPAIYITGIDGQTDGVLVQGNHFENNKLALNLRSGGGTEGNAVALREVRIVGNSFLDNADNIALQHIENSVISDNTIINNEAIRPISSNIISFNGYCNNVIVSNNNIKTTDTTYACIGVANAVTDINVFANSTKGGIFGISASGAGTARIIIGNNIVVNTSGPGIVVDYSASQVLINGNSLYNASNNLTNIVVSGAGEVNITNNIIKGTGGAGYGIECGTVTNVFESNNYITGFQFNWLNTWFVDGDTTPDVSAGNQFVAYNTTPVTITMFDGGTLGKHIGIFFQGNSNTTIDFTGTLLRGNAGVDWNPGGGDWMEGYFDGQYWNFAVHDCTS